MHKVFVSYHHANDQLYKDSLVEMGRDFGLFIDKSVDTGDIPETWSDPAIRQKIRDEYLRDSTVTILLAGADTRGRKHVDWELYSSMFDGTRNKKSGIVVIDLPTTGCNYFHSAHGEEEQRIIYPEYNYWPPIGARAECESRYPHLPERILDNLAAPNAGISVVPWERLTAETLEYLIDITFNARASCEFNISRPMKRRNSYSPNRRGLLSSWQ